jgi:uncharacterized Rmd1/YagE family protein
MHRDWKEKHKVTFFREVIHLPLSGGDVYCFAFGSVVFWNLSKTDEEKFLEKISKYAEGSIKEFETDIFTFSYGKKNEIHLDTIVLADTKSILAKLAISYGIAQSSKLSVFEQRTEQTIQKTEYIPQSLEKTGKIPLSRRKISQMIGRLMIERNMVNLHSNILDTPDFFWEQPKFEPLYQMTIHDQDITDRIEILNKRLDIMRDLFGLLGNEINHSHASTLEWIIIILIFIEVLLTLTFELFLKL